MYLSSNANLNKIRIFGVLQRFGICYFVVATSCFLLISRDDNQETKQKVINKIKNFLFHIHIFLYFQGLIMYVRDILKIKFVWLVALISLVVHTLFVFLFQVPDCPRYETRFIQKNY